MTITVELLRAALIAALYYHPVTSTICIPPLLKGRKLKNLDSLAGDAFANLYTSVFRFPPDEYELWAAELFEDLDCPKR